MNTTKYVIADHWWTAGECQNHPNCLYIFGDNDLKVGCRGQAIIRDQPNALGLPTKKVPTLQKSAFYSDLEYEDNVHKIEQALNQIISLSHLYEKVIFPKDGLGTGLAQLPQKAPRTHQYLLRRLNELFDLKWM